MTRNELVAVCTALLLAPRLRDLESLSVNEFEATATEEVDNELQTCIALANRLVKDVEHWWD